MSVDFVHLAKAASFHIVSNCGTYAWPPVVFCYKFGGFGDSGVSSSERIVKMVNHPPP